MILNNFPSSKDYCEHTDGSNGELIPANDVHDNPFGSLKGDYMAVAIEGAPPSDGTIVEQVLQRQLENLCGGCLLRNFKCFPKLVAIDGRLYLIPDIQNNNLEKEFDALTPPDETTDDKPEGEHEHERGANLFGNWLKRVQSKRNE